MEGESADEKEARLEAATETLRQAEAARAAATAEERAAEQKLAEAREAGTRAGGQRDQVREAWNAFVADLRERLNLGPDALEDAVRAERRAVGEAGEDEDDGGSDDGEPELPLAPAPVAETGPRFVAPVLPSAEEPVLVRRVADLTRRREALGAVNLRAAEEYAAARAAHDATLAEREDVQGAIDRLRRAIADINRDGRARLLAAFEEVDAAFGRLFERLYGGGRARLELVEKDDPLDAGLEILASPPGKKLQSLGLLSGGEQALTALALLFAVFLSNPAPICVLDEVDAPLDDANVDRFLSLVEEIAAAGRTRFLVVTHHRMTMARMDRLYGVTMVDRGVSRLVSVDLTEAERMVD